MGDLQNHLLEAGADEEPFFLLAGEHLVDDVLDALWIALGQRDAVQVRHGHELCFLVSVGGQGGHPQDVLEVAVLEKRPDQGHFASCLEQVQPPRLPKELHQLRAVEWELVLLRVHEGVGLDEDDLAAAVGAAGEDAAVDADADDVHHHARGRDGREFPHHDLLADQCLKGGAPRRGM